MKKFFIELCWNQFIPYIHLKDLKTKNDEFFDRVLTKFNTLFFFEKMLYN